jgi:hypothetical protein
MTKAIVVTRFFIISFCDRRTQKAVLVSSGEISVYHGCWPWLREHYAHHGGRCGYGKLRLPSPEWFFTHRPAWGEGNKVRGSPNTGAAATAGEATWNQRLQGTAGWTAPGALSDAGAVSASTAVGSVNLAFHTWSGAATAADVQNWLDNPAQTHGWLLYSQSKTTPKTARQFGSRRDPASNAGRPAPVTRPEPLRVHFLWVSITLENNCSRLSRHFPLSFLARILLKMNGPLTNSRRAPSESHGGPYGFLCVFRGSNDRW